MTKHRPLLGNGRNRFVTRTEEVAGEAVFSTRSVRRLRNCWERFSVQSVPSCYKQDKSVVRQSPGRAGVNTETEEATALEALTTRQPVKVAD
jgi:hypothetical protein